MESFKFTLFFIVTLVVVGVLGYWAVVSIEPANISAERQKQVELKKQNDELKKEVIDLNREIQALKDATPPSQEPSANPTKTPPATTTPLKYQSLINDLQKLVDANVLMKEKSQGTRVGTVQTFLNIYNKTSKPVDNDFGPGMKTDVMNFQKAVDIPADGEAGPGTFKKMIEWLKKQ